MNAETDNGETFDLAAVLREHIAHHGAIAAKARTYLAQIEAQAAAGIVVIREHCWLVVSSGLGTEGAILSLCVTKHEDSLVAAPIPGDLVGISCWSKGGAEQIAAHWRTNAPSAVADVKIMLDHDAVKAVLDIAEQAIAWARERADRRGIKLDA